MKKNSLKIFHLFVDILFVGFMLTFGYIFFTVYYGQVPNLFGYHFLRVISTSMTPVIDEGDCIVVKSIAAHRLEVGDIITFHSEDPYIYGYLNTHRIVSIETDENDNLVFHTKGDANSGEDVYTVKEENIIGKYCGELAFGELLTKGLSLLSNQKIYFMVVMMPILLCMISSIVSIIRILFEDETEIESIENIEEQGGRK
ncbi:MAG: signal peptidase I [Lachnospiraceae bacterium]|nr:signal peptidase I [Lachnospiraceae bacterium]